MGCLRCCWKFLAVLACVSVVVTIVTACCVFGYAYSNYSRWSFDSKNGCFFNSTDILESQRSFWINEVSSRSANLDLPDLRWFVKSMPVVLTVDIGNDLACLCCWIPAMWGFFDLVFGFYRNRARYTRDAVVKLRGQLQEAEGKWHALRKQYYMLVRFARRFKRKKPRKFRRSAQKQKRLVHLRKQRQNIKIERCSLAQPPQRPSIGTNATRKIEFDDTSGYITGVNVDDWLDSTDAAIPKKQCPGLASLPNTPHGVEIERCLLPQLSPRPIGIEATSKNEFADTCGYVTGVNVDEWLDSTDAAVPQKQCPDLASLPNAPRGLELCISNSEPVIGSKINEVWIDSRLILSDENLAHTSTPKRNGPTGITKPNFSDLLTDVEVIDHYKCETFRNQDPVSVNQEMIDQLGLHNSTDTDFTRSHSSQFSIATHSSEERSSLKLEEHAPYQPNPFLNPETFVSTVLDSEEEVESKHIELDRLSMISDVGDDTPTRIQRPGHGMLVQMNTAVNNAAHEVAHVRQNQLDMVPTNEGNTRIQKPGHGVLVQMNNAAHKMAHVRHNQLDMIPTGHAMLSIMNAFVDNALLDMPPMEHDSDSDSDGDGDSPRSGTLVQRPGHRMLECLNSTIDPDVDSGTKTDVSDSDMKSPNNDAPGDSEALYLLRYEAPEIPLALYPSAGPVEDSDDDNGIVMIIPSAAAAASESGSILAKVPSAIFLENPSCHTGNLETSSDKENGITSFEVPSFLRVPTVANDSTASSSLKSVSLSTESPSHYELSYNSTDRSKSSTNERPINRLLRYIHKNVSGEKSNSVTGNMSVSKPREVNSTSERIENLSTDPRKSYVTSERLRSSTVPVSVLSQHQVNLYRELSGMDGQQREMFCSQAASANLSKLQSLEKQVGELTSAIAKKRNTKKGIKRILNVFRPHRRNIKKMENNLAELQNDFVLSKQRLEDIFEIWQQVQHENEIGRRRESTLKSISEHKEAIVNCTRQAMDLRKKIQNFGDESMDTHCYDCCVGRHAPSPYDDSLYAISCPILCADDGFLQHCPIVQRINVAYEVLKLELADRSDQEQLDAIKRLQKEVQWGLFRQSYLKNGQFL